MWMTKALHARLAMTSVVKDIAIMSCRVGVFLPLAFGLFPGQNGAVGLRGEDIDPATYGPVEALSKSLGLPEDIAAKANVPIPIQ